MTTQKNRKSAIEMINEFGYDRALAIAMNKAKSEDSGNNWLYIYQAIVSLGLRCSTIENSEWIPQFSVINTQRSTYRDIESIYEQHNLKSVVGRGRNLLTKDNFTRNQGTSIFSPAIAHICYSWFSEKENLIFDPFCGGPVRGIVAYLLERSYLGIDIRKEQIEANKSEFPEQSDIWKIADACEFTFPKSDMIFTCPPYYNLEIYSELKNDLSSQESYNDFLLLYRKIIEKCCLSCNGYIVFVVNGIRDSEGFITDIPKDTTQAFDDNGFGLYNEIILYSVGNAALRINFSKKKVTNVHQKILVYKRR